MLLPQYFGFSLLIMTGKAKLWQRGPGVFCSVAQQTRQISLDLCSWGEGMCPSADQGLALSVSWPGVQIERITKEAGGARREAAAQRALARTLAEAQALAEEEGLRQEAAIKDLRNELADKEVALQNAQRKLFQARASRWAFAFVAAG